MSQSKESFDVAIIGAGAAGLAAAYQLYHAGQRVVVLEARDRLGGRIDTKRLPDWPTPVELGAEEIHGEHEALLSILHKARLRFLPGYLSRSQVEDGTIHKIDEEEEGDSSLLSEDDLKDISIKEKLDLAVTEKKLSQEEAQGLRGYVEGFYATDTSLVSSKSIAVQERAAEKINLWSSHRLPDGYDQVTSWMAQSLDPTRASIRLQTVVYEVQWSSNLVEIKSRFSFGVERVPILAKRLIITVPIGVLQATPGEPGAIRFTPELPASTQDAITHFRMGDAYKPVFLFQRAFWRDSAHKEDAKAGELSFFHTWGQPFPTWWTKEPLKVPVLTGWAAGAASYDLQKLDEATLVNRALQSLAEAFQLPLTELESLLVAYQRADWRNDPFARGAYAFVLAGHFDAIATLATPIEGTLFFAGEATEPEFAGTVHGAIVSGQRAAEEVLKGGV